MIAIISFKVIKKQFVSHKIILSQKIIVMILPARLF